MHVNRSRAPDSSSHPHKAEKGPKLPEFLRKVASRIKHVVVNDFFKFTVSLTYTKLRIALPGSKWEYCSEIKDLKNGTLFLGAIPLKSNLKQIATKINTSVASKKDHKNKSGEIAFLSAVEPHETLKGKIYEPALKRPTFENTVFHEESASGVKTANYHVSAPDFGTMNAEMIEKGVKFIEESMKQGKPVYVHCKAGRARSATIVAAYLLKNERVAIEKHATTHGLSFNTNEDKLKAVMAFMKQNRTQIDIGKDKQQAILDYLETEKL